MPQAWKIRRQPERGRSGVELVSKRAEGVLSKRLVGGGGSRRALHVKFASVTDSKAQRRVCWQPKESWAVMVMDQLLVVMFASLQNTPKFAMPTGRAAAFENIGSRGTFDDNCRDSVHGRGVHKPQSLEPTDALRGGLWGSSRGLGIRAAGLSTRRLILYAASA